MANTTITVSVELLASHGILLGVLGLCRNTVHTAAQEKDEEKMSQH